MNSLKISYLNMKGFLRDNQPPIPGNKLLEAVPQTELDIFAFKPDDPNIKAVGKLAESLPLDSLQRKLVIMDAILTFHTGEARTNPTGMATYSPTTWTSSEILDQITAGRRPEMKTVVGYFWAPGPSVAAGTEEPRHFVRRVQSWDLPSMVTLLGNTWTFEQIYKVWNEMPLTVPAGRRGKGPGIQEKKKAELKEQNLPEEYDMNSLKISYLNMKGFLRDNQPPIPGNKLLPEELDIFAFKPDDPNIKAVGKLAESLPLDSLQRKLAIMDAILTFHTGEARTNPTGMATYSPTTWTSSEILDQITAGRRPEMKTVVGYFWAPGPSVAAGTEEPRHFVRRVQSWDLPSMVTLLGNTWTFEQIYKVWNEMPLTVPAGRRGKGPGIQEKKKAELKEQNLKVQEVKSFLHSLGLRHPKSQAEVKTLYRELGVFLAASTFLARTPTPVMDLPEAAIQDTKEHMRFRATCDERVTLPLSAFHDLPGVYDKLCAQLGTRNVVEVQMAWRCNCDLWWVAVVPPAEAEKLYRKLGYSEEIIATFMRASVDAGADRVETVALGTGTYPLLSVDNVSSICSPAYRREKFGNKAAHAFWGKACCGLNPGR
eukprot:s2326_g8.t1